MLIEIVDLIFNTYRWMLIASMISGFFPQLQRHSAVRFLMHYTQPYLNFFRPLNVFNFPIDFISPLVAMMTLSLLQGVVLKVLTNFSYLGGGI